MKVNEAFLYLSFGNRLAWGLRVLKHGTPLRRFGGKLMRRIGLLSQAAAMAVMFSWGANGAAVGLKEHSADAMASAYAGAAATQSDASYLVYNPA
ncbi:MAG TPA: hypothetical protein VFK30_03290, partial [Anaerolineae bacterium]|nr:hypothetical protein [Anaerolineae bacterium]